MWVNAGFACIRFQGSLLKPTFKVSSCFERSPHMAMQCESWNHLKGPNYNLYPNLFPSAKTCNRRVLEDYFPLGEGPRGAP